MVIRNTMVWRWCLRLNQCFFWRDTILGQKVKQVYIWRPWCLGKQLHIPVYIDRHLWPPYNIRRCWRKNGVLHASPLALPWPDFRQTRWCDNTPTEPPQSHTVNEIKKEEQIKNNVKYVKWYIYIYVIYKPICIYIKQIYIYIYTWYIIYIYKLHCLNITPRKSWVSPYSNRQKKHLITTHQAGPAVCLGEEILFFWRSREIGDTSFTGAHLKIYGCFRK